MVVADLDRLARYVKDAQESADGLASREAKFCIGGSALDPTDPMCTVLFNVLAMTAGCEADLIRVRKREGLKVAKANGRRRGKQRKLSTNQKK